MNATTATTAPAEIVKTHVWEIPAYNLGRFQARIAQANTKLARAGLDARFDVAYEHFIKRKNTSPRLPDGTHLNPEAWIVQPWVRAELAGPVRLAHGHFTFVAALTVEEGGVIVRTAPGVELGGFEPVGNGICQHCHTDRARTRLYLVRDERDGSLIQLGHNCIELYTGVAPKGLWVLGLDEELRGFAEETEEGFAQSPLGAQVDTVIAWALAVTNRGRRYVSVARGEATDRTPTGALVREYLFSPPRNDRNRDEFRAYLDAAEQARAFAADTSLIEAVKASAETVNAATDYGRNLRVALAGESGWVSGKSLGLVASLVAVYAREQEQKAENTAAVKVAGFLGEVGERIRAPFEIRLTTVRELDGDYGVSTLFIGTTADGHAVKWFATGSFAFDAGDTLPLLAASVKTHEVFNGTDVTVLTRGKIDQARAAELYGAQK